MFFQLGRREKNKKKGGGSEQMPYVLLIVVNQKVPSKATREIGPGQRRLQLHLRSRKKGKTKPENRGSRTQGRGEIPGGVDIKKGKRYLVGRNETHNKADLSATKGGREKDFEEMTITKDQ